MITSITKAKVSDLGKLMGNNSRMGSIIRRALVDTGFILNLSAYFLIYVGWFIEKCAEYLTEPF